MSKANRPCCVDGCGRPVTRKGAKGMCPRHYQRMLRGVPVDGPRCESCPNLVHRPQRFCSDECKPRCTIEGCDGHQRKRTWCASHYVQWQRYGREPEPFKYKWANPTPCIVCGDPPGAGYREFCSSNCRLRWERYDGNPPDTVDCIGCGLTLSLHERGKKGQRRKASTKFCRRCKSEYGKYKLTAAQLAERDGTDCGICGEPVDMALRRSESTMCASVDHIIPRALGGTHEPENLQLAHLYCNQVKSDGRGSLSA